MARNKDEELFDEEGDDSDFEGDEEDELEEEEDEEQEQQQRKKPAKKRKGAEFFDEVAEEVYFHTYSPVTTLAYAFQCCLKPCSCSCNGPWRVAVPGHSMQHVVCLKHVNCSSSVESRPGR